MKTAETLAPPASSGELSSISPKAQAEFVQALHGGKGDLDAWLECNSEAEVRAHVLALVQQPAASGEQPAAEVTDVDLCADHQGPVEAYRFLPVGTKLYTAPQPAASGEPGGVAAFAEGQWWLQELDAMVASGTDDQKRAVAVVRNLLRTAHSTTQPAPARVPATVSDLLRRSRNLLSHPPLWWQENEASRERLIGQLDAALHDTTQPAPARVPLTDEQIDAVGRTSHGGVDPQEWFRNAARAIERAHGITPAKEAP